MQPRIAKPGTCARIAVVVVGALIFADPLLYMWRIGLVPPPFQCPPADLGFLRQSSKNFEFAQAAANGKLLHQTELRGLLHRVDEILAVAEVDQHIRL